MSATRMIRMIHSETGWYVEDSLAHRQIANSEKHGLSHAEAVEWVNGQLAEPGFVPSDGGPRNWEEAMERMPK